MLVTGVAGALAIAIGGVIVGKLGIEVVFYIVGALFLVSPILSKKRGVKR